MMTTSLFWPLQTSSPGPELAPHQEEAVRWILDRLSIHRGALLADEVGLGKSWVAARVAMEKALLGKETEVIVPASLAPMWKEVLAMFGVEAVVRTHERLRRSPFLRERCGLIIVDEAHRFRNSNTKGWRRLADRVIGTEVLFLTATPIWNHSSDLWSLLRVLVPDDALKCAGVASIELGLGEQTGRSRILRELVLRRSREVVPDRLTIGEAHDRQVRYAIPRSWSGVLKGIDDLSFPLCLSSSTGILRLVMLRRLHSSVAALRYSLERQKRFCETGLDLLGKGYRLNRREFTRLLITGEGVQELLFPQLFLDPEDEPDADALTREGARIGRLLESLHGLEEPKADRLASEIASCPAPSLIFVSAVETARALDRLLSRTVMCAVASGSYCRSVRGGRTIDEVAKEFREGASDVLILTDLGGEGLNLQRARRVIHYDLPCSPMRIEQRNGRARRIGHAGELEIVTFVPEEEDPHLWELLQSKRREQRAFWCVDDTTPVGDPSLARLPSHITSVQPQVGLWTCIEPQSRSALLCRYRSGVELRLDELVTGQAKKADVERVLRANGILP